MSCGREAHLSLHEEESGRTLRHYWTGACRHCPLKSQCAKGNERRIKRWEHEHLLEAVQRRLDANPQAMRQRRETVEHPFGTLKMRMGATHFLMKRLPKVASTFADIILNLQEGTNLCNHFKLRKGDVEQGFRKADLIVDNGSLSLVRPRQRCGFLRGGHGRCHQIVFLVRALSVSRMAG